MRQQCREGIFIICLLAGLFVCQPDAVWGLSSKKQDCQTCDVLTDKDALSILDTLRLNEAKVLKIQASPIQGLWEVAVENRGDRFLVYVDCSRKFVMPGPIIERQTGIDRTRQRVEELNKERRVDLTGLRFDEALVMGNPNAAVKVIGFLDPD
jgi:thiol:disulfide interchange protein DsbC